MNVPKVFSERRIRHGIGMYLRKSTEQQPFSLAAQERIIRQMIVEPSGLPVYRVYTDVLSGTRRDRCDYQQMLADARAGKFSMVVFHKINRFGRDAAEGLMAINELRHLGIEVRVADMPSLDIRKPEGMLVFTFMLAQGQYEVENLSTEALKGMREAVLHGQWVFFPPDGYRQGRVEGHRGVFRPVTLVDRPRAAIIRLIFAAYATGRFSLQSLADFLNALHQRRIAQGKRGVTPARGETWRTSGLHSLLQNRFYCGEISVPAWKLTVPGRHRPIISTALFHRVHAVRTSNTHGPRNRHTHLLQEWVRLRDATKPLHSTVLRKRERTYQYYYYYDGKRRIYFDGAIIETHTLAVMRARLATLTDTPIRIIHKRIQHALGSVHQDSQAHLRELNEQQRRLIRFGMRGIFSEDALAVEMSDLRVQIALAEHAVAHTDLMLAVYERQADHCVTTYQTFAQWEDLDAAQRQAVLREIVEHVVLSPEGNVERVVFHPLWDALTASESAENVRVVG